MVFENSFEYLRAQLEYLDLLLRREVLRWRENSPEDQLGGLKGAFISDREIDVLLGERANYPAKTIDSRVTRALIKEAYDLQTRIAQRRKESLECGVYLTLPNLADLFGLTSFEEQVVLVCLAPEIDLKYGKLYAYLQDDITRKRPSVDLVLKLLCPSWEEKIYARSYFSEEATLIKSQIISSPDSYGSPLLSRFLQLDNPIVSFLLETRAIGEELANYARISPTDGDWKALCWPEGLKDQLVDTIRKHFEEGEPSTGKVIWHFHGPRGIGKKTLAAALCKEIDSPILVVNLREVLLRSQDVDNTVGRIFFYTVDTLRFGIVTCQCTR